MKKFISSILAVIMMLSCMCVYAEETAQRTPRQESCIEACGLLSAIGILDVTDENYDNSVTRGKFASVICKMYPSISGTELPDGEKMLFRDVSEENEHYGDIKSVYAAGYMIGKTNRYFGTDDAITLNEASKVLTTLLGYEPVADVKGGYSSGYLRTANEKGFLTGLKASGSSELTYETLAQLIKNTMTIDFMTVTSVGSKSSQYGEQAGTNILNSVFDIYLKENGIITAIGETDIYGISSDEDGKIKIDRETALLGEKVKIKYGDLGIKGNFYIRKTEKDTFGTLVYFLPNTKKYTVKYFSEDNYKDLKDVKINSSASVIYNGEYYGTYSFVSENMLKPEYGGVTLVDNTGDKKYDVIVIRNVKYATVESVNYKIMQASIGLGVTVNGRSVIRDDDTDISIFKNDEKSDITAIGTNDLLEIEEPKGSARARITVVSDMLTGWYTGYSKNTVSVDEEEYPSSENVLFYDKTGKKIESVTLDTNCSFYRSSDGKIVLIIPDEGGTWQYGFFYQAKLKSDIDGSKIMIRILQKNNTWLETETTEKTVADGEKLTDLAAALAKWQRADGYVGLLCRYKLDSKKNLKELDTAADPLAANPTYPGANEDEDSLCKVDTLSNFRADWTGGYNWAPDSLYKIQGKTALCYLPTDLADEDLIKFIQNTEIVSAAYYDVNFYSPDDMMIARAATISAPGGETISETTLSTYGFVITDMSQCVDNNGEQTVKLKGIQAMQTNAQESEFIVNADAYQSSNFYNNISGYENAVLHRGAVIRFTVNSRNEITKVRIYFSCMNMPSNYYVAGNGQQNARCFGEIAGRNISEKYVKMQLANDPAGAAVGYKSYALRGVAVYDSARDEFRIGDASDAEIGDKGFMYGNNGHPMLFFIVK